MLLVRLLDRDRKTDDEKEVEEEEDEEEKDEEDDEHKDTDSYRAHHPWFMFLIFSDSN